MREDFEGLGKSFKVLGRVLRSWEEFEGLGKSSKELRSV
jgi:hypothetical protein